MIQLMAHLLKKLFFIFFLLAFFILFLFVWKNRLFDASLKLLKGKPDTIISPSQTSKFIFGDEYAHPDLAQYYSQLGTRWTKISDVNWSSIEPQAPQNKKHSYDWSRLDAIISAYQEAKYHDFHIVLKPDAPWATQSTSSRADKISVITHPSYPLKPGFENDYYAWVYDLAERYDFDGAADMPGLKGAVTYFEIMSEPQHAGYFAVGKLDRAQEYKKILQLSHQAVKEANPQAKIILAGITFGEVFDNNPSE